MSEFEHKLKMATSLAGKGKVSRRDFIQLAMLAGFTAAAGNAMAQGGLGDGLDRRGG